MVGEIFWYYEVWNGDIDDNEGWTKKGPFTESLARHEYERHTKVMPNCPARLKIETTVQQHLVED